MHIFKTTIIPWYQCILVSVQIFNCLYKYHKLCVCFKVYLNWDANEIHTLLLISLSLLIYRFLFHVFFPCNLLLKKLGCLSCRQTDDRILDSMKQRNIFSLLILKISTFPIFHLISTILHFFGTWGHRGYCCLPP